MSLATRRRQDMLRALIQRATLPQLTVTEIANEAHLSPQTIGKFVRGGPVTDEQEASIARALLVLLPEGKR